LPAAQHVVDVQLDIIAERQLAAQVDAAENALLGERRTAERNAASAGLCAPSESDGV